MEKSDSTTYEEKVNKLYDRGEYLQKLSDIPRYNHGFVQKMSARVFRLNPAVHRRTVKPIEAGAGPEDTGLPSLSVKFGELIMVPADLIKNSIVLVHFLWYIILSGQTND